MRLTQLSYCCVIGLLLIGCATPLANSQTHVAAVPSPTLILASQAKQIATSTVMLTVEATESNTVSAYAPDDCPVTQPQQPMFVAPPPNQAIAPWSDQFWYGTDSLFIINPAHQLQSNAKKTDTLYLSTALTSSQNIQWQFFTQMKFAPSSSNFQTAVHEKQRAPSFSLSKARL